MCDVSYLSIHILPEKHFENVRIVFKLLLQDVTIFVNTIPTGIKMVSLNMS